MLASVFTAKFFRKGKAAKNPNWRPSRPGYLDLFSGSEGAAKLALRRCAPWVLTVELKDDPLLQDLSRDSVQGLIEGLLDEGATDSWGAGINGTNFSYSASTGEHTAYLTGGTTQGTAARLASNVPNGEWVSLKNPVGIKLDDVELRSRNASDWYSQYPTDFQFWGSNDGTTWSHIKTFTGQSANGQSTLHRYHINSTIFYNRHALVVTKIPGTASTIIVSSAERHFHLSEIRFNGHEEGSGSIDTTLKTVYNVPATTGTQLGSTMMRRTWRRCRKRFRT